MSLARSLRRRREVAMVVVALAAAGIAILLYATHLLRGARAPERRRPLRRARHPRAPDRHRHRRGRRHDLRPSEEQWPFPRSLHAQVIDSCATPAPARSPTTSSSPSPRLEAQDNALIEAVEARRRIVLSTTEVDKHGAQRRVRRRRRRAQRRRARGQRTQPDPTAAASAGTSLRRSTGPRRLPRRDRRAGDRASRSTASEMDGDGAWIDYPGPPGTFRRTRSRACCAARCPPRPSADKIVDRRRRRAVAAGRPRRPRPRGDELMSGPEISGQRDRDRRSTASRCAPRPGVAIDLLVIALLGLP